MAASRSARAAWLACLLVPWLAAAGFARGQEPTRSGDTAPREDAADAGPPDAGAAVHVGPSPIASGFTPDPLELTGTTRGARPLSGIAPGCRGYVGDDPDQLVSLTSDFAFLRLFVTATDEVTLALRGPDGAWHCSGQPLLGSPREEGAFGPGRYEVWIGGVQPRQQIEYTLAVTEFHSVTPATGRIAEATPLGGGADLGLAVGAEHGRFRDRRLRRGFLPDPRVDQGDAGGPIDVSSLGGGCRGHVEGAPSHVLVLRDDLDYFRIGVRDASGTTSLVVRTPRGAFLCSAPEDVDPAVDREAWPQGRYAIWVGSREPNAQPHYHIVYTETRPPAAR